MIVNAREHVAKMIESNVQGKKINLSAVLMEFTMYLYRYNLYVWWDWGECLMYVRSLDICMQPRRVSGQTLVWLYMLDSETNISFLFFGVRVTTWSWILSWGTAPQCPTPLSLTLSLVTWSMTPLSSLSGNWKLGGKLVSELLTMLRYNLCYREHCFLLVSL